MILLVGLGNPGREYALTRHNVGYMAVDEIVRRHSFDGFQKKFKGLVSSGQIQNEKVLVLKPETFMNLSGESVGAAMAFYKIKPADVIVFHDDMDLPLCKVKVKQGGGSGGHNGLKSIDGHIGPAYRRVRIGIDKPAMKEQVVSWVLSNFPADAQEHLSETLDKIADHVGLLLAGNEQTFMNRLAVQPSEKKAQ